MSTPPTYFTRWTWVVAHVIRGIRRAYRAPRKSWARRVGVSPNMIAHYELGRNVTSLAYTRAVSQLVGVPAADIIALAERLCDALEGVGVVVLQDLSKETVLRSWQVYDLRLLEGEIAEQIKTWSMASQSVVFPLEETEVPRGRHRGANGRFRSTEFDAPAAAS